MNKYNLLALFFCLSLLSCNDSGSSIEDQKRTGKLSTADIDEKADLEHITGKYSSGSGDLEIASSEGMLFFKLLVVWRVMVANTNAE